VTVTVSEHYVPSCEECCAAVERIIRAAIRDITVTKVSLTPSHRHNHEVEEARGGRRIPEYPREVIARFSTAIKTATGSYRRAAPLDVSLQVVDYKE
jgi:hypothetical protein